MKRSIQMLLLSALLLGGVAVPAAVTFTLTPVTRSGVGSNSVAFLGSFTNSSATTNIFLNQLQYVFAGPATNYLTADTNAFFANVPGILLTNENYADTVFVINIATNTPPGVYTGTATAFGGGDVFATATLATQTFGVAVTDTPLGITRVGNNILLSWPSPPASFTVQQSTNLLTTNWVTLSSLPGVTNGQNQVAMPGGGTKFYRLKYP